MRVEDAIEAAYKNGYEAGKETIIPQGKWSKMEVNTFKDHYSMYVCSHCKNLNERPTKFCPNCGAEMNKEKNE